MRQVAYGPAFPSMSPWGGSRTKVSLTYFLGARHAMDPVRGDRRNAHHTRSGRGLRGRSLTEAVIFDRPPAYRPAGYAVFKIIGRAVQSGQGHVLISVVEPAAGRRLAPSAWLAASPMSSCTTWGRLGRKGYVVARFAGALRGRPILEARTYTRSWLDFLWSRLGLETYRASAGPTPH